MAWGANEKFNFAKEDMNDDLKFNEVIWRSVRGADHPMPAPVHAGFVFTRPDSKDDVTMIEKQPTDDLKPGRQLGARHLCRFNVAFRIHAEAG